MDMKHVLAKVHCIKADTSGSTAIVDFSILQRSAKGGFMACLSDAAL
jgi:hypothetical protein